MQEIFLVPSDTWRFGTICPLSGNNRYYSEQIERGGQTTLTIKYGFALQTLLKAPGSSFRVSWMSLIKSSNINLWLKSYKF